MSERRLERVEEWESRPISGLDGLRDLADQGFSGVVRADDLSVFVLNGRVVGVTGGELSDLRDASGTAFAAPHRSLPLLFAMRERGGETQAKYYTNDTPLSEAMETLSDAGFTGYVALSENVLSGDYYVVFHGGNSMSLAFVGASEELLTDDEALERARDEVGIYEVVSADVDVRDVPGAEDDDAGNAGADPDGAADDGAARGDHAAATPDQEEGTVDATADAGTSDSAESETSAGRTGGGGETADADADTGRPADDAASDGSSGAADRPSGPTRDRDREETPPRSTGGSAAESPGAGAGASSATEAGGEAESANGQAAPTGGADEDPFQREEQWQETVSIPALAPDESATTDGRADASTDSGATATAGGSGGGSSSSTRAKRLLKERTRALEEARDRLEAVVEERDDLRRERDDLRQERDRLRERVEELREEVSELRSDLADARAAANRGADDAGDVGGESLAPGAAMERTDLFVRYGSRGDATVEDVPEGAAREEVSTNLRLDHHTQFDAGETTVDDEPFEAFLRDTVEFGFVSWLVEQLPFEIRETGHESELSDLYGALPEVDRAEFGGTVEFETEDGSVTRSFDVVLRDRMGGPLIVADLNDSRSPVTGEMMTDLADAAGEVAANSSLAAAFYVTASFFEPAALEAADERTGGGFLSRDSRASFVKTGRKSGFHLCLVETRNGSFYLNVPEL